MKIELLSLLKWPLISLILFAMSFRLDTNSKAENYINEFKDIAISEMHRKGVPASIKLAQGLLESSFGKSPLATVANNHFGIKCGKYWEGKEFYREDDDYDASGNLMKSCFRVYDSAHESYIGHSEFLTAPKKLERYGHLFYLERTDYRSWAHGLKASGYATDPKYPQKLISIIERYNLSQYDLPTEVYVSKEPEKTIIQEPVAEIVFVEDKLDASKPLRINGVRVEYLRKGESLNAFASRSNQRLSVLRKYNDQFLGGIHNDIPIYLARKRDKYYGEDSFHVIKEHETMFSISQMYGIKLDKLYSYNRLPNAATPLIGETLKLDGFIQWGRQPQYVEKRNGADNEEELLFSDEEFTVDSYSNNK